MLEAALAVSLWSADEAVQPEFVVFGQQEPSRGQQGPGLL